MGARTPSPSWKTPGGEPDIADSDGDGLLDPECGGDDCAIDDPWVAPGLEEWCNDVDRRGEPKWWLAGGASARWKWRRGPLAR